MFVAIPPIAASNSVNESGPQRTNSRAINNVQLSPKASAAFAKGKAPDSNVIPLREDIPLGVPRYGLLWTKFLFFRQPAKLVRDRAKPSPVFRDLLARRLLKRTPPGLTVVPMVTLTGGQARDEDLGVPGVLRRQPVLLSRLAWSSIAEFAVPNPQGR
jgi:hypothetical protein